jgi:hypothetical protein
MLVGYKREVRILLSTKKGNGNLCRNVFEFFVQVKINFRNESDKYYFKLELSIVNALQEACRCKMSRRTM